MKDIDIYKVLNHVDHTILHPCITWDEVKTLIREAIRYQCASVCIPPSYVRRACAFANKEIAICTVIGFPNGYDSLQTKLSATREALENGADEIDMVINLGDAKEGYDETILQEIKAIKEVCGTRILKVIVETCYLTQKELIRMCAVVEASGADFIKTSTGFGNGGATHEDICLMREHLPSHVKIKASGGIKSLEDGFQYLEEGATRLGSSSLIKKADAVLAK